MGKAEGWGHGFLICKLNLNSGEIVTRRSDRWWNRIIYILETELGVTRVTTRQKKRRFYKGTLNGRPFSWTVSLNPADKNAVKAAIRELKKELAGCGYMEPLPAFPSKSFGTPSDREPNSVPKTISEVYELLQNLERDL